MISKVAKATVADECKVPALQLLLNVIERPEVQEQLISSGGVPAFIRLLKSTENFVVQLSATVSVLSLCLSVRLSGWLSVSLRLCLSVSVSLSLSVSICLCLSMSVCLSVCLSVSVSVSVSLCLSVSLSLSLSLVSSFTYSEQ